MKIVLFHYHLQPGGVTDVIVYSIRAILTHISSIKEIRLVSGISNGINDVMIRIRKDLPRPLADKLKSDVLGEIAYTESGQEFDVSAIIRRLEARYDEDTLWWIHNYHIGKNPWFTAALMNIARSGKRNMLLHIHDFPECGRLENLNRLDAVLDTPPYPSGPGIRYAVINERDRKILSNAGLNNAVSLLSNPVPSPPVSDISSAELKAALIESCSQLNPGFLPDGRILLYPVRAIRRKNILEAAMMAILLDEPANVIVTLPGVSAQEKAYSRIVESAFKKGLIPGVWCPEATGNPLLTYPKLASGSDGIISTSVQEGFGYLFLNALHWRKPLIGRYLDILDGILEILGEYPRRFWAEFRIPADKTLIQKTQQEYLEKIKIHSDNLPEKSIKTIKASIKKLGAGGGLDISFLSITDQLAMLEKARDPEWTNQARLLNRELLDSISRTLMATAPSMVDTLESHFSDIVFARKFSEILAGFGTKTPSTSPGSIREAVGKAFGRIDYFRLLYDY